MRRNKHSQRKECPPGFSSKRRDPLPEHITQNFTSRGKKESGLFTPGWRKHMQAWQWCEFPVKPENLLRWIVTEHLVRWKHSQKIVATNMTTSVEQLKASDYQELADQAARHPSGKIRKSNLWYQLAKRVIIKLSFKSKARHSTQNCRQYYCTYIWARDRW